MLSPAPTKTPPKQSEKTYNEWVETKFEQYRDEITILQARLEACEGLLATRDQERADNLRLIDSLESTVKRIHAESKLVLADHVELQSRFESEALRHKETQIALRDLRIKLEKTEEERQFLREDQSTIRNNGVFLSNELHKLTEKLTEESEARNNAEKLSSELELRFESAVRERESLRDQLKQFTLQLKERETFHKDALRNLNKKIAELESDKALLSHHSESFKKAAEEARSADEKIKTDNVDFAKEKTLLSLKLADERSKVGRLELELVDARRRVAELQESNRSQEHEKSELAAQLKVQVENSRLLCGQLVSVKESTTVKKDIDYLKEQLADAKYEVKRLRQQVEEKPVTKGDTSARDPELGQLTPQAPEVAILKLRVQSLEQQLAQIKAEKSLQEAEILRLEHVSQRLQLQHTQEIEDIRLHCERSIAETSREANKKIQNILFEEEKKRLNSMKQTTAQVESDPRLARVVDLENVNVGLKVALSDQAVQHTSDISEKERFIRDLQSQLLISERGKAENDEVLAREQKLRILMEGAHADERRHRYMLISDYVLFVQNSEAWLREVLQKVCLLSMQKLYYEFIKAALHRREVLVLKNQLRDANDGFEILEDETQIKDAKIDGLNESLQNEVQNSRALANKFMYRDKFTSPTKIRYLNGRSIKSDEESFILSTRWDLASELCKQDVRCEVVHENAAFLISQCKTARLEERIMDPLHDFVELVQTVCDAQSQMSHLYLTVKERNLLQSSKALSLSEV